MANGGSSTAFYLIKELGNYTKLYEAGEYSIILNFGIKDIAVPGEYNITLSQSTMLIGSGMTYIPTLISSGTVTVKSDDDTPSPYTISATTANAKVAQGDNFDVNVEWSKIGDAENPASAQGYLNYDAGLVAPGTLPLGVAEAGSGKLKFADFAMSGNTITTIPFAAVGLGDAVFSVSGDSGFKLAVSVSGTTEMIDADPGDDLTVTIESDEVKSPITFDAGYSGLPSGYKLLRYEIDEKPTGTVWKYDGKEMRYASIGGAHFMLWMVEDTVSATDAEAKIASETGTPAANNGDLNGDGALQIVDAQIAYDIAAGHANYNALAHLDIALRLKADANGDGQVTIEDARAIQQKLLTGSFPWEP
jgi:hypothetical protein